jgi:hypothetical protein
LTTARFSMRRMIDPYAWDVTVLCNQKQKKRLTWIVEPATLTVPKSIRTRIYKYCLPGTEPGPGIYRGVGHRRGGWS